MTDLTAALPSGNVRGFSLQIQTTSRSSSTTGLKSQSIPIDDQDMLFNLHEQHSQMQNSLYRRPARPEPKFEEGVQGWPNRGFATIPPRSPSILAEVESGATATEVTRQLSTTPNPFHGPAPGCPVLESTPPIALNTRSICSPAQQKSPLPILIVRPRTNPYSPPRPATSSSGVPIARNHKPVKKQKKASRLQTSDSDSEHDARSEKDKDSVKQTSSRTKASQSSVLLYAFWFFWIYVQ